MKRATAAGWVTLTLIAGAAGADHAGREQIRAADLRRDVKFLSGDSLAGRETGRPGIRKAEKYIARQFERAGLVPLPGRDDYWIDFSLYRMGYEPDGTSLEITTGQQSVDGGAGVDFRPFPFSDEGSVEAPVVFAGYGITAPEHGYDDYEGIDVEGKIVLVLRHEPGENDPDSSFDGTSSSNHALFATKGTNAREHGAAGMLLVTDPLHHGPDDDLRLNGGLRLSLPETPQSTVDEEPLATFLAAHISREIALRLLVDSGRGLAELQRAVDEGAAPSQVSLGDVTARLSVERASQAEIVAARNVAALLPGRDPQLRDEWIVIGGHHDHVGGYQGQGDTVFNGADDNASGTSGVLALARAFAEREPRPRRSIAFVTFSAEEKGLLGSRALVEQQLMPVERVVFMLNLDMIGRNPDRSIQLFGDGYVRGLRQLAEQANHGIGLSIDYAGATYAGNSDHDSFYSRGIPFMFFFTGVHEDYHQLGDHADKLDYDRMESIVEVAYGIVERLAEADEAPGFVHHVNWLGVRVEVLDDGHGPRAVVTGIDQDSRAQQAGLATGDILVGFDGTQLADPDEVGRGFGDIEPGTTVALGLRRGDERLTIEVQRAKTGYLGVAPGPLDEDQRSVHGLAADEGILLRQVMSDGPSDQGGLREGDIVIRIDGRPIGPANLGQRLTQIGAGETVEVTIIRDAQRMALPITLGERPRRR